MYINVSHQKKTMIYAQKEKKRTSALCSFCTRKEDTAVGVMTMRATMHKAIVLLLQNAMTRWYK
jgi:hypothetical protein